MRKLRISVLLITAAIFANLDAQYLHFEYGTWQENVHYMFGDTNDCISSTGEGIFLHNGEKRMQIEKNKFFEWNKKSDWFDKEVAWLDDNSKVQWLYQNKRNFFYQNVKMADIAIDPVLFTTLSTGIAHVSGMQTNGRGVVVKGQLRGANHSPKLAFFTRVLETQSYNPNFVQSYADSFGVIPGYNWWKKFKTNGSDFIYATGYINAALIQKANAKNFMYFQSGYESVHIGHGYRSLILGGMGNPFTYAKINSKLGIFRYQNMYAVLNGFVPLTGNNLLPKKYLTLHRGELDFGRKENLKIGFSEMIIHSRLNGNGGFDLTYLNPIIFYRSLEADQGSADNAFMALDLNYEKSGVIFYSQFVIDEWKLSYIKSGKWWGNKSGYQLGLLFTPELTKVKGLLIRMEFNKVRPYTYSHYETLNSYSHYNQPLAHPLESNFSESILKIDYMPFRSGKWNISLIGMHARKGMDSSLSGANFGGNLRRDNDTRIRNNDIYIYQGLKGSLQQVLLEIKYQFAHNYIVFLTYQKRKMTIANAATTNSNFVVAGLKINFDRKNILY